MASLVSVILGDKDFVFLPKEAYEDAVDTAFMEYMSYYPFRKKVDFDIDSQNYQEVDILTVAPDWKEGFSVIVGLELLNVDTSPYTYILAGTYVRPNYYDVYEDFETNSYLLRIMFRYKGRIRMHYTVPFTSLEEVPTYDLNGIKYLACYYACLSSVARVSQMVENYINADKMTYDRRGKNFMELADMYKKRAYSLLNIPDEGVAPYSAGYAVPYIERRRAIRRTN